MKYYRVLNQSEEPSNAELNSEQQLSEFRKQAIAMFPHSEAVCNLSKSTGMQLKGAMCLAQNIPCFLDIVQQFIDNGKELCPLIELCVDDPIEYIKLDDLIEFSNNYIGIINDTELYFDIDNGNVLWEYIWEYIRENQCSNLPSRLKSVFLFNNKKDASDFFKNYRDNRYSICEIKLLLGKTEDFDMNWFTNVPSNITFNEAIEYAENYWGKKQTSQPIIETLHQGLYSSK
jgi:hypothetical protein